MKSEASAACVDVSQRVMTYGLDAQRLKGWATEPLSQVSPDARHTLNHGLERERQWLMPWRDVEPRLSLVLGLLAVGA